MHANNVEPNLAASIVDVVIDDAQKNCRGARWRGKGHAEIRDIQRGDAVPVHLTPPHAGQTGIRAAGQINAHLSSDQIVSFVPLTIAIIRRQRIAQPKAIVNAGGQAVDGLINPGIERVEV